MHDKYLAVKPLGVLGLNKGELTCWDALAAKVRCGPPAASHSVHYKPVSQFL